jgi:hypothetical protein
VDQAQDGRTILLTCSGVRGSLGKMPAAAACAGGVEGRSAIANFGRIVGYTKRLSTRERCRVPLVEAVHGCGARVVVAYRWVALG